MALSARLQRTLAAIRSLAREGVVESTAADLGLALGLSERRARQAVFDLVAAGLLDRENRRGEVVRLVLVDAPRRTDEVGRRTDARTDGRAVENGRSDALPYKETSNTNNEAAAAAALKRTDGERTENGRSDAENGRPDGRLRFVIEGDPLLLAEFMAHLGALRGDVSRGNGGIVHRDLKPENVLVEDLTDDERVAVAERFAQFKDAGEPVRNVARMTELVVADCRRSPAILSGYIEASKERAERARRAQEDRDRIAKQKADDERAAKALLDSMPRSPKRP